MEPIRVTEPLNYFLEPWKLDWYCRVGKREANRICKEAQLIGTAVDGIIKNGKGEVPKKYKVEVENCLKAYRAWKEVYQPKEIVPGTRLFATIDGIDITGEPDLFVDGVLVDIKCSKKISLTYWIQVCVYRYLINQPSLNPKVAILRLDKITGSYEYVQKDYDPSLVDMWVSMMKLMLYLKGEEADDDCS